MNPASPSTASRFAPEEPAPEELPSESGKSHPVQSGENRSLPDAASPQSQPHPRKYWIGVASNDHVLRGVEGGFCQLSHGKRNPLNRLSAEDWLIYYSPRIGGNSSEMLQSFTAIGKILPGEPYLIEMADGFTPYRRNVQFVSAQPASIKPLIEVLSFIRNKKSWGYAFRFGLIEISAVDFRCIAAAMRVDPELAQV